MTGTTPPAAGVVAPPLHLAQQHQLQQQDSQQRSSPPPPPQPREQGRMIGGKAVIHVSDSWENALAQDSRQREEARPSILTRHDTRFRTQLEALDRGGKYVAAFYWLVNGFKTGELMRFIVM